MACRRCRVATTVSMRICAVVRVACAVIPSEESTGVYACAESTARAWDDRNLIRRGSVSAWSKAVLVAVGGNWLPNVLATVSGVRTDRVGINGQAMAIARVVNLSV